MDKTIQELLDHKLPVFGICFGHQLLSLALGGSTYKLKFGHHGANHPVKDLLDNRIGITSQNHGYAVRNTSLPQDWYVWFSNANDGTVEGIRHISKPFYGVQFHPEASPGPLDTGWIFDEYVREVKERR